MSVLLSSLLARLKGLQLSISQWIMVSMAAIIGGLVVSLRLQGSALHKAQLGLLKSNLDFKIAAQHKDTDLATISYELAKEQYEAAKK